MKYLRLCLAIGLLGLPLFAQESKPTATLFAELGVSKKAAITETVQRWKEQLCRDNSSRGYLISYGDSGAIKSRRSVILSSLQRSDCGHDGPRITFVDSITEGSIRTTFWIVPPGALNPNPDK